MCGIFGYSGDYVDANKLKILALYNDSRGGHATGVYSDRRGIIKNTYSADRFVSFYNDKFLAKHLFLGHTRYKTHGENTIKNAHPYQYGKTIGIHNGVLDNYNEIAAKYDASIDVDSQCIFLAIENNSQEEYILPEIIGAMAIAYTKSDGLLYLYRRDNPIFVGFCGGNLYFSSLLESLEAIDCNELYELGEHKIYSFDKGVLIGIVEVTKPKRESFLNWGDYVDGFDNLPYTKNELAYFGISAQEIDVLCNMPLDKQEDYLAENGYLD